MMPTHAKMPLSDDRDQSEYKDSALPYNDGGRFDQIEQDFAYRSYRLGTNTYNSKVGIRLLLARSLTLTRE